MTLAKRLDALEQRAGAGNDLESVREWVQSVGEISLADLQAIERREWDHVQNVALRNTTHRERWERAVPALMGAFYSNTQ